MQPIERPGECLGGKERFVTLNVHVIPKLRASRHGGHPIGPAGMFPGEDRPEARRPHHRQDLLGIGCDDHLIDPPDSEEVLGHTYHERNPAERLEGFLGKSGRTEARRDDAEDRHDPN
jgi:hypothetical protein